MTSISSRRLFAVAATLYLTGPLCAFAQTKAERAFAVPSSGKSSMAASPGAIIAQNSKAAQPQATPAAAASDADQAPLPTSPLLNDAIKEYKAHADQLSWDKVEKELKDYLATSHATLAAMLQANPGLQDVGLKVLDAAGARVYYFPKVQECHTALLQSLAAPPPPKPVGRGKHAVAAPLAPAAGRLQFINLPLTAALKEARIVHGVAVDPKTKATRAEGPRFLVFIGSDKTTGSIWLQAYKATEVGWAESNEVMSGIPPFLLQNLAGKATFSNNDIVLNVTAADNTGKPTVSSGYKIVLRLLAGKYTVEGKPLDDGPYGIALQFVQAVQQGRQDLAKAWLVDPKLISITRYIGMNNHGGQPCKVIAMASAASGASRFRVMTYDKDDLILDIGKIKQQWAIKGMFIAPPDPLAQKLSGSVPQPSQEPKPAPTVNK